MRHGSVGANGQLARSVGSWKTKETDLHRLDRIKSSFDRVDSLPDNLVGQEELVDDLDALRLAEGAAACDPEGAENGSGRSHAGLWE